MSSETRLLTGHYLQSVDVAQRVDGGDDEHQHEQRQADGDRRPHVRALRVAVVSIRQHALRAHVASEVLHEPGITKVSLSTYTNDVNTHH